MRRKRKLIPTILLTILSWGSLGFLVYKIPPTSNFILLFFLLFFLALLLSFALLFANTRRGFLFALGILTLALLRFFHLFHPLYIVLVLSLLLTTELFFLRK